MKKFEIILDEFLKKAFSRIFFSFFQFSKKKFQLTRFSMLVGTVTGYPSLNLIFFACGS